MGGLQAKSPKFPRWNKFKNLLAAVNRFEYPGPIITTDVLTSCVGTREQQQNSTATVAHVNEKVDERLNLITWIKRVAISVVAGGVVAASVTDRFASVATSAVVAGFVANNFVSGTAGVVVAAGVAGVVVATGVIVSNIAGIVAAGVAAGVAASIVVGAATSAIVGFVAGVIAAAGVAVGGVVGAAGAAAGGITGGSVACGIIASCTIYTLSVMSTKIIQQRAQHLLKFAGKETGTPKDMAKKDQNKTTD
jgi:hypothetical protein